MAEGFERGGKNEFIQFLSIAKGSAGELETQMYIALDQGYVKDEEFKTIQELIVSTKNLIGGLISYLKNSNVKGHKYKYSP